MSSIEPSNHPSDSYKAVVYTGSIDPLVKTVNIFKTVDELIPGPDELLVKVHACSCNPTDYKHYLAHWGVKDITVGSDLSGTVVKIGSETKKLFKIGDYVASFVHGGYTYQPFSGAFQEYVIVSAATTLKFNNNLYNIKHSDTNIDFCSSSIIDSFEAASSLPLGLATVGMSLHFNFKLDENKKATNSQNWILIWGGTTATGFLAIQIAKKLYGLKVITTANASKYNDILKSKGADEVVDYHDKDMITKIKDITTANGYKGVVYALDTVSNPDTYNSCYSCLKEGESYLDNLLSLQPDILKTIDPKKKVNFLTTLVYLVNGKAQNLNGTIIESSKELVESFNHYWNNVQRLIDTNQISHIPLTILPNGLESANDGLRLLSESKVSCHKIVLQV